MGKRGNECIHTIIGAYTSDITRGRYFVCVPIQIVTYPDRSVSHKNRIYVIFGGVDGYITLSLFRVNPSFQIDISCYFPKDPRFITLSLGNLLHLVI